MDQWWIGNREREGDEAGKYAKAKYKSSEGDVVHVNGDLVTFRNSAGVQTSPANYSNKWNAGTAERRSHIVEAAKKGTVHLNAASYMSWIKQP